ncbi:MAG: copper homeostasis protein CutC [Bacteroidales bacterium]|nr:copper homeostasis protein CutC [Bacteroidales bacterium]
MINESATTGKGTPHSNLELEVCCGSWQSALAATEGGARRIELCQALTLDGLTPSLGLLRRLRARFPHLLIHVLIRVREGHFVYTEDEVAIMETDIREAVAAGASAIVCGALTADGDIDLLTMRRWITAANGVPITFHRAFDEVRDPQSALEELIELGVTRVLTTGGRLPDGTIATSAEAGIPALRKLVDQAADRIIIMPGCGVNSLNARKIIDETGAREIHGSCQGVNRPSNHHNAHQGTQSEEVAAIMKALEIDNVV